MTYKNQVFIPGQGNNVYIFPGIGLGTVISKSPVITEDMFLVAARTLADQVNQADLDNGTIYPPNTIRQVSLNIAIAVAEHVYENKLTKDLRPENIEQALRDYMYDPSY